MRNTPISLLSLAVFAVLPILVPTASHAQTDRGRIVILLDAEWDIDPEASTGAISLPDKATPTTQADADYFNGRLLAARDFVDETNYDPSAYGDPKKCPCFGFSGQPAASVAGPDDALVMVLDWGDGSNAAQGANSDADFTLEFNPAGGGIEMMSRDVKTYIAVYLPAGHRLPSGRTLHVHVLMFMEENSASPIAIAVPLK